MKFQMRVAAALLCLTAAPAFAADDGKFAEFDGVKIHHIDRGKGEPIVLLHGGTSSLDSWVLTGVVAAAASRTTPRPMAASRRSMFRVYSMRSSSIAPISSASRSVPAPWRS